MKLPFKSIAALVVCASTFLASEVQAQTQQVQVQVQSPRSPWSAEVFAGWDIGLSGDFLSAGIGTLNGVPVVFQSQPFDDVYGNGALLQFNVAYSVDDLNEARVQVTYQQVGADVSNLGTAGAFELFATFDGFHAWSVEAGGRHYFVPSTQRLRPYGGASIGVSIISEIDGAFASPAAGLERYATDLYDGTAALTIGLNGGVIYALNDRFDLNGQLGVRYNSGLSAIDALVGTGLEDVNDKSSRWTLPITVGVRIKF